MACIMQCMCYTGAIYIIHVGTFTCTYMYMCDVHHHHHHHPCVPLICMLISSVNYIHTYVLFVWLCFSPFIFLVCYVYMYRVITCTYIHRHFYKTELCIPLE